MSNPETQLPVRVLLADNHTMFRHAIMALLQADGDVEIVGDAGRGDEAVALAEKLGPDVVIMQVDNEVEKARDEIERILAVSPRPRVIILSLYDDPGFVRRVLGMGPSAYVHKSSSVDELLSVVRSTTLGADDADGADGVVSVPERVLEQVQNAVDPGLSARELESILWAARGYSNRQIANRLSISEATVRRHLANAYPKIGVNSRYEAVSKGLSEGWILEADITVREDA
jgi:two-component system nitrate/nitrite response regulator NarL